MTLSDAVEKTLVRHPTVGFFMGRTYDFLIGIGIDANRLRFRQHASDEMAHYATDCWDVEIEGSYGWVECVGIAHRGVTTGSPRKSDRKNTPCSPRI